MTSPQPGEAEIVVADAVEWIKGIPTGSVDLIVTDPAYASLEKHRAKGTTTRLKRWFPVVSNEVLAGLVGEFYRVLHRDRHCYVFSDWETAVWLQRVAVEAGFQTWTPLVWDRMRMGMGYHYRHRYELISFWETGTLRLADLGVSNVLAFQAPRGGYPTEKPQALVELLIWQSLPKFDGTQPDLFGERRPLVVDPFVGGGTTAAAALACGCDFKGCDVLPEAVDEAKQRIGQ